MECGGPIAELVQASGPQAFYQGSIPVLASNADYTNQRVNRARPRRPAQSCKGKRRQHLPAFTSWEVLYDDEFG